MIHKINQPKVNYKLLSNKNKILWSNILIVSVVLFIGFTCIGILAYNFIQTTIIEEKLIKNAKVPIWIQWIWKNSISNQNNSLKSNLTNSGKKLLLVCYYSIPSSTKFPNLLPKQIDYNLCTHIIIGFSAIKNYEISLGGDSSIYQQVLDMKKQNPSLKIMISVGGGGQNGSEFSEMVSNHAHRMIFVKSALNITKNLDLDGLDLDWEFPVWADENTKFHAEQQRVKFIQLLQELHAKFNDNNRRLILSVAVAAIPAIIDTSYIIPNMAEHVDFINLMSYDYHFYVWYYPVTQLNSPLFPGIKDMAYLADLNVNFSANYWISKGMPREKIVIGVPTFGHSFKLINPLNHDIEAPAQGFGDLGSDGFIDYKDVCTFLKSGASKIFVNDSRVPYAFKDYEWISYDDTKSIQIKAEWIKRNGFGGAMVFSLNSDDWISTCEPNRKFPLINTIKKILENHD